MHSNIIDTPEIIELREITQQHERGVMESTPDVGQFLRFLMRMLKAKNVVEVGSFTGKYSHSPLLLSIKLTLPQQQILAFELKHHHVLLF